MNAHHGMEKAAFGLIVLMLWFTTGCSSSASATPINTLESVPPAASSAPGYKDASYEIEGRTITLSNGVSEIEIMPGSASKIVTKYFGNEAKVDLNGDGLEDIAFLLTQNRGGSGTFFYAVAALKSADGGYTGTNAILLGDRIAPQVTEGRNGAVIVNYADRAPGEPMTSRPSIGFSNQIRLVNGRLVTILR